MEFLHLVVVLLATALAYLFLKPKNVKTITPALHTSEYRRFKLIKKTQLSPNTARYRFALPDPTSVLGLPIGRHIQLMAKVDGKEIARSYTPTSTDQDHGFFELVVKTYPQGAISSHLGQLSVGDSVNVRGPRGAFKYTPNMVKSMCMIAGGTGITPMYQIIQHILDNPQDATQVSVIFANVNEDDILLREQLDRWVKEHQQFNIHYVLNNPPEGWQGGEGFVTKEMIQQWAPTPAPDMKVLLCGPPPMVKAMDCQLAELGYDKARVISKPDDQVFKF